MNIRDPKKGVAVVEFAVLLLLLLLILAGVVEFGLLWLQSHYLTNAAREGARVAGKQTATIVEVRKAVTAYLSEIYPSLESGGYASGNCCDQGDGFITINVANSTISSGDAVTPGYTATVTVKNPIRIFSGGGSLLPFLASGNGWMSESAFFPCETSCKIPP